MSNLKNTLIDLSKLSAQVLNSSSDKYVDVFCIFKYNKRPIEKIVPVPVKSGANNSYYISTAKAILADAKKSGELVKYCERYLKSSASIANPILKVTAITGVSLLAVAAIGAGAFFLGKHLTPGGGSDGLIEVTFDAVSTEDHLAYFNNDPALTVLKVKVGKGITFGEVKKLASNLTRHTGGTVETPVYDILDAWSDITSEVSDDRVLNDNLTVSASYKPETVKLTIDASGNTLGTIRTSWTADTMGAVSRTRTFEVNKGTTLKDALYLADIKKYIEPTIVKSTGTLGEYTYDDSIHFTFFRDATGEKDIYPPYETTPEAKRDDYEKFIIDRDVILTANYSGMPSGDPVEWLNVTFYAADPISTSHDDYHRTGVFKNTTQKKDSLSSNTETKNVVGIDTLDDRTTFAQILELGASQYKTPEGTFATFKHWTDETGKIYDPNNPDTTTTFPRDVSFYAYYEPDFQKDTFSMIAALAKKGKNQIKEAYNLTSDKDIYNLEKDLVLDGVTYTVRVIGVATDFQEFILVDDPYERSYKNGQLQYDGPELWIFSQKPSALTLQFITPYGDKISWGHNSDLNYLYQNENCNIKKKLDELDTKLESALGDVLKTTKRLIDYDGDEPMVLNEMEAEYQYDGEKGYEMNLKSFLIGGRGETLFGSSDHDGQIPFVYNPDGSAPETMIQMILSNYTNLYGEAAKDKANFKTYWSRWDTYIKKDWCEDDVTPPRIYKLNTNLSYFDIDEDDGKLDEFEVENQGTYDSVPPPCTEEHYLFPAFAIGDGIL